MALSRDTVANLFVKARITDVINDVQIGIPINEAMKKHPVFDAILVSMIRVGEESGMLGDSLFKMAELFESQTDESTQRLTDMMTPIMTVVIGGVVGFFQCLVCTMLSVHQQTQQPKSKNSNYKDDYHFGGRLFA